MGVTTAGASGKDFTCFSPIDGRGLIALPRFSRRSWSIAIIPCPGRPDSGLSITGGYVYRGKKIPGLVGVYVYGDFDSGRIWGLRYEKGKLITSGELIDLRRNTKLNIASFAEDSAGELYILAFDGRIHEFVPRSNSSGARR